jgi:hypothetical protein
VAIGNGFDDKFGDLGENDSLPDSNRLPMLISIFDNNQWGCLGASRNVGGAMTFHLCSMHNKDVHYHNTPSAPDPVKLDPHLSPLGGRQHPLQFQNFIPNCLLMQWIMIQVLKDY